MKEIVADLKAEQESLDRFISSLREEDWNLPTPAVGWDVKDSVFHIARGDQNATSVLKGDFSMLTQTIKLGAEASNIDALRARVMKPAEVMKLWRQIRVELREELLSSDPKRRLPWGALPMSARSFATARLMETWAHGLDCYDTLGVIPEYTDRLRHIAMLAYIARPYAYQTNGLEPPSTPLRLELRLPSGKLWTQGPEDAVDIIRGLAREFCRVAVRRGHWQDTSLEIIGTDARSYVGIAQTYAGPPGPGRKPKKHQGEA